MPISFKRLDAFAINYGFIETMGMKMKEGRSFSRSFGSDSTNIVLNETAVKAMGLKDPVGKTVQKIWQENAGYWCCKGFSF